LREAIKQLEAQKKETEAIIREALGEAKVGFIKGVKRVELKDGKSTYFDRELMEAEYPEAFTNTLRVTPYTKIVTM
jgi:predicted phage-related endonuclease